MCTQDKCPNENASLPEIEVENELDIPPRLGLSPTNESQDPSPNITRQTLGMLRSYLSMLRLVLPATITSVPMVFMIPTLLVLVISQWDSTK